MEQLQDVVGVDEIFDTDDLALIASNLSGSGASAGYSGSGSAVVTDSVLGAYATLTSAGTDSVSINSNGYAGFIDYFTVQLPEGTFVPMIFSPDPSYTMNATGAACGLLNASVQVGIDDSFVGFHVYTDSTCGPDSLATTVEYLVPTGVPFRVLYELSASAFAAPGAAGTATVDALNSLSLFADAVGSYTYTTLSGNSYRSPAPVPEPGTLLLLVIGLAAIGTRYRRRAFVE